MGEGETLCFAIFEFAFVFATFQLPGIIEALFQRFEPHLTDAAATVLFTVALYGKAIAFTLIATFMVHLIARAHWVALLGVHSVFPNGIRWDEMKMGPISKDVYRTKVPDLSRAIAKLDNFCSVVFSAGLLIVILFAFSTLLGAAITGVAYLLAQLLTHGQGMKMFFWILMAIERLRPTLVMSVNIIGPRMRIMLIEYMKRSMPRTTR